MFLLVLLQYLLLHIFLVADACFSGSLFVADEDLTFKPNNDEVPSRWALTSGNMEEVADGETGTNSPFAKYLIQGLQENSRDYIPVSELINFVKFKVKNEYNQSPIGKPLNVPGNRGGEYLLYMKK